ncbi:hypothetical protein [Prauserella cavernicola]|uniref:Uncharacterized protein n=1 Tax=Prauserella cavernicola TaxID=2800127 RepID=A0A934QYI7_9PSEU|nr:hypothetical protein [Prauserella cavernicola]MBK1788796.1 hypothetical protein [Prauserella cavernicola]
MTGRRQAVADVPAQHERSVRTTVRLSSAPAGAGTVDTAGPVNARAVPSDELRETARLLDECDRSLRLTRFSLHHATVEDGIVLLRDWMLAAADDLEGITDPPVNALDADVYEPHRRLVELAREIASRLAR